MPCPQHAVPDVRAGQGMNGMRWRFGWSARAAAAACHTARSHSSLHVPYSRALRIVAFPAGPPYRSHHVPVLSCATGGTPGGRVWVPTGGVHPADCRLWAGRSLSVIGLVVKPARYPSLRAV